MNKQKRYFFFNDLLILIWTQIVICFLISYQNRNKLSHINIVKCIKMLLLQIITTVIYLLINIFLLHLLFILMAFFLLKERISFIENNSFFWIEMNICNVNKFFQKLLLIHSFQKGFIKLLILFNPFLILFNYNIFW